MFRLTDGLMKYGHLKKLSLPRLCCDPQGFRCLANLIKTTNLEDLEGIVQKHKEKLFFFHFIIT